MPDSITDLYHDLGIERFASPTRIAEIVSTMNSSGEMEPPDGIEILLDPQTKEAYDLLLEAWSRPDRLIPRFADSSDVEVVRDVAEQLNLELKEVHPSTYQVIFHRVVTPEPSSPVESASITIGSLSFQVHSSTFEALSARSSGNPILEIENENGTKLIVLKDSHIQKLIQPGAWGRLFQIEMRDSQLLNAAVFVGPQNECHPLSEAGRFMFCRSRAEIASYFRVRDSSDRVKQLIRNYYLQVAGSLQQFDPRIDSDLTLKSFATYAERHF